MKFKLRKNKGPTKVDKMCMYCGTVHAQVMSASLNCLNCHKPGLRTIYGKNVDGSNHIIPEEK